MKPVAWMIIDVDNGKSLQFKENKFSEINIPLYTAPSELSDEEIEECIVAWVKEIYGNEYVTPSDSHITQGTRLIKLAEEMRLNK